MRNVKKIMIMGLLGVMMNLPVNVQAADCANGAGTEIKGNDHGTYCVSKVGMNWWSAHAWCDAIGMKLVSLSECECRDESNCDMTKQCPNLYNTGSVWAWQSTISGSILAYDVSLHSGDVKEVRHTNSNSAFCMP